MDILETLVQEHSRLRELLVAMNEIPCESLPENAARLEEAQKRFAKGLAAHERLEERFVEEALELAPGEAALIKGLSDEHRVLDDVVRVLEGLVRVNEEPYSIKFAIGRLAHDLESHLAREESSLFPNLRRLLTAGQLEALGWRLRRKPALVGDR